jgi:hypothetical protein
VVNKESKNDEILLPNRKSFLKDVENGFFRRFLKNNLEIGKEILLF